MINQSNDSLNPNQPPVEDEPQPKKTVSPNRNILRLIAHHTHHLTDLGNAQRFAAQFEHKVRYVPSFGWFLFDGVRWHLDDSNQILALAHSSIESYYEEACSLITSDDYTFCERLLKHAENSESLTRLNALLTLARSLPGISVPYTQFDSHPYLITCLNGTLDLRTGTLLPHDPKHYITRLIPVDYNPAMRSPFWEAFLARFTDNNPTLQAFLQRAVGYSLTGLTNEGTCFLLSGPGQRAQQIFLSLLRALFADYSSHLPALHPKYLTPSLAGSRLATIPTPAFLSSFDPSTLATLIEAEPLPLSSSATCQPQTKLWFSSPELPQLPAALSYIGTRITVVPIALSLSNAEAAQLHQQLLDELPAILTWAAQGYQVWSAEGLLTPECVTAASSSFQDEQDNLGSFLETCCTTNDSFTIRAHDLYQAYTVWSHVQDVPRLTEHAFGRLILLRGFRRTRQNTGRIYHGLALHAPFDQIPALLRSQMPHM